MDLLCSFCLVFAMPLCASVYMCLVVTCWESFCFICSKQCIQIILSSKKSGLLSSLFKKVIPNNTTPTFQEVGGVI